MSPGPVSSSHTGSADDAPYVPSCCYPRGPRQCPCGHQVGDLAICIGTEHFAGDPADPKPEDMLRVKHVCTVGLFLHFDGKPDNKHWIAANFRKVKPDREPAADEEWVEQLQRFRRKEVA